jgi:hypothetical protein
MAMAWWKGACNALQKNPSGRTLVIPVEVPQMLPWAEERYKAARNEAGERGVEQWHFLRTHG